MSDGARHARAGRPIVHVRFTDRRDGDLRVGGPPAELEARRARLAPLPWTWLQQVHGDRVVVVNRPGDHAGEQADAAVTAEPGATLAVHTADCAGVLLEGTGARTVIGAAHAGWRGLALGVLEATVQRMRDLGAEEVRWRLGPCISPSAYEFGEDDLVTVTDRLGPGVAGTTDHGTPALDLRAGVAAALAGAGAVAAADHPATVRCTALDDGLYSWRARRDDGRQAALTWMEVP